MKGALRLILYVLVGGYVTVMLAMFTFQRNLQYFPRDSGLTPAILGLRGVEEITIRTGDGENIVAWFAAAKPDQPTILFFQGNGGDLADRHQRMRYYQSQGFGALFVSYRGYGKSSGSMSERGLINDAVASHAWLVAKGIAPESIVVVGESLGTGVAVQLAAQRPVAAVALEAPYAAAVDVAARHYWWLPVRLLMKDTFRSRDFIGKLKIPLLVQHGDRDGIIPVDQGRVLYAAANEPKELVILPGEGHDVIFSEAVWQREVAFFRQHLQPSNAPQ
ncbi:MAG TPA: alpha/beta fold hydrolase [Aestuariivirga sp.]|nr:alpha/beta fold hydrolase [Aestuariivirga sp.]